MSAKIDETQRKEVLEFDAEDLRANRSGKLSERQSLRLRAKRQGSLRIAAISAALLLALIAFAVLMGISWFANLALTSAGYVLLMLIPVVVIISLLSSIRNWRGYTHDLEGQRIGHVDGQVEMRRVAAQGSIRWRRRTVPVIRVSDHEFRYSPAMISVLDPDRRYRVYFTLYSNIILSVDLLASAPKMPQSGSSLET